MLHRPDPIMIVAERTVGKLEGFRRFIDPEPLRCSTKYFLLARLRSHQDLAP
jgi:hypothetical protein